MARLVATIPCVPALVLWMIALPRNRHRRSLTANCRNRSLLVPDLEPRPCLASEWPVSPLGAKQIWPIPASRSASASSTERTITMREAPFAKATAAVVKARNTSMIATAPVARVAPSSRLWIEIFIFKPERGISAHFTITVQRQCARFSAIVAADGYHIRRRGFGRRDNCVG
jgi:hypothetical protein